MILVGENHCHSYRYWRPGRLVAHLSEGTPKGAVPCTPFTTFWYGNQDPGQVPNPREGGSNVARVERSCIIMHLWIRITSPLSWRLGSSFFSDSLFSDTLSSDCRMRLWMVKSWFPFPSGRLTVDSCCFQSTEPETERKAWGKRSSGTRQPGNPATRRPGDPATRRPGNPATRQPDNLE